MTCAPESRQRLLVAGPDPEDRELTVRALTALGYDVVAPVARARSGLEAIDAAARHRPDLVVVGLTLPGTLDGAGAARAIDEIYGIPAVVVAGEGREGFGRTPGSLPYVVLRKPFDLHDMEAAVETALGRPASERERGPEWPPTADRGGLLRPAAHETRRMEHVSRDVDEARDLDADPSGMGRLTIRPWRSPPPSDAP